MFTPLIVVAIAAAAIFIWWRLSKRTKPTTETPTTSPVEPEQPVETEPVDTPNDEANLLLVGDSASYTYDSLSRLKTITYQNGTVVTINYDSTGNRTSVVTTCGGTC